MAEAADPAQVTTLPPPVVRTCKVCRRENAPDALVCAMCSALLGRERSPQVPVPNTPVDQPPRRELLEPPEPREAPVLGIQASWFYLGLGALLAPVLTFTPMLQYIGWFVASLVHEMGHCVVGFAMAVPMYPAIRLDGHAAAITTTGRVDGLAYATIAVLLLLAYAHRKQKALCITLVVVAVCHPLLAFTSAADLLILLGGGLGELAFATLCFTRVRSGGFTHNEVERALYAGLGWYLVARNVVLCFGLMTSARARNAYGESGSFGLTNDYIRVAEDVLGCPLPLVAAGMLLLAFLPLPLGWWISRRIDGW